MINMYAYTYPQAKKMFLQQGYILTKVGDSHRDVEVRMKEQGGAAEWEGKIRIGAWPNLKKIDRDYRVHEVLTGRGLWHSGEHGGTEWFKIPAKNETEARKYIDDIITSLEGNKVRKNLKLRKIQERTLAQAMAMVEAGGDIVTIIANLCPRFGKTIWALSLFNRLSDKYRNRVMLLPAYWLAVHASFINELDEYAEFNDIVQIDIDNVDAEMQAKDAISKGMRIIVPLSLHGDVGDWQVKHQWLTAIPNEEIFCFADEGDFGTHADNQKEKLSFLFDRKPQKAGTKFVSVYASGTNVQRLAKCSQKIDGVIYTAYAQLEKTEPGIIHRKFYCTEVTSLKQEVEALGEEVMPSWVKINSKPLSNESFLGKMYQALVGDDTLRPELNLSNLADERIDCFMLLTSANKKEMGQMLKIAARYIPDWHVKVLNGDFTTNFKAEKETTRELNEARIAGKKGVMIIANQMGSRSYSVPAIQATVIAFDRGSVDATQQKVSRCLTPAKMTEKRDKLMYDGSTTKGYGVIVDLSFDPNRAENIERIILEEAIQVQRSGDVKDFAKAVKYVLSSIDLFKLKYGNTVPVSEEEMFGIFGDNDVMLKVADVSVDVAAVIDSGLFDIFSNVTAAGGKKSKKEVLGKGVKNTIVDGGTPKKPLSPKERLDAEKIINQAIHALNMSATSVYYLAKKGESYRECLNIVAKNKEMNKEFVEFFGVDAGQVIELLNAGALNEAILDVIVQNSKPNEIDFLF